MGKLEGESEGGVRVISRVTRVDSGTDSVGAANCSTKPSSHSPQTEFV